MSCVACSGNIERKMQELFDTRGLQSVSVVLLTCKMTTTFIIVPDQTKNAEFASEVELITADEISQAVKALGFGCRSIGTRESSNDDMSKDSSIRPLWSNLSNDFSEIKT